jgi:hypothetical protein
MELEKMEQQVSKQIRKKTLPERTVAAYYIKGNLDGLCVAENGVSDGDNGPRTTCTYTSRFLQRFYVFGIEEKDLLLVERSRNLQLPMIM